MKMPVPMSGESVLREVSLATPLPEQFVGRTVAGIAYDSRKVQRDFLFFAFAGANADGRQFAMEAMARGACAVVSEQAAPDGFAGHWIQVAHARQALALASRNFFGKPDEQVQFTGITGTNGKTTTAYLLDAILRSAGKITAIIGTIEYRIAGEVRNAVNTTPESLDVVQLAYELQQCGGTHLTMEVSSHALALDRVYGLHFHTAVFTNLTQDHLDFHQTLESYAAAKRLLFNPRGTRTPEWSVLNQDDPASQSMTPSSDGQVVWYGMQSRAALYAENIQSGFYGLSFDLTWGGQRQPVRSALAGRVNVWNVLAATGAALSYGLDLQTIAKGIESCKAVPGRFERIDCGQPFLVVVDFAHTEAALRNVIQLTREMVKAPGRVITLFGCGGDRDRTKRPLMGAVAAELSDYVVLTSDNPRSEDPLGIMNDVMVGLGRYDTPHISEPNRAIAIGKALVMAQRGDAVLFAGKGHEAYQILKDRTLDFDDRAAARAALQSMGYTKQS